MIQTVCDSCSVSAMVQSVCDPCSVSAMVQSVSWSVSAMVQSVCDPCYGSVSVHVTPVQFLLWFQWDDEGKSGRDTMSVGLDGLEIDRYIHCKLYLHTVKYCSFFISS
jgi:hypothetical protein